MTGFNCKQIHPDCTSEPFKTGKAWKIHATRSHGGYSEEQWLEVSRAASVPVMGEFSERPPETESRQTAPAEPPPNPQADRLQAMKLKLAGALAKMVGGAIDAHLGMEPLKAEDHKTITEGFEEAMGALNIQPEIEKPEPIVLRSKIWILIFPLLAVLTVIIEKVNIDDILKILLPPENEPDSGSDRAEGTRKDNASGQAD